MTAHNADYVAVQMKVSHELYAALRLGMTYTGTVKLQLQEDDPEVLCIWLNPPTATNGGGTPSE